MTDKLTIALAQINPKVGDLEGNRQLILEARAEAAKGKADLIVFPELAMSGYPPEDLVLNQAFLDATEATITTLAEATNDGGPALLIGAPWRKNINAGTAYEGKTLSSLDQDSAAPSKPSFNAVLLLDQGIIKTVRVKHDLPNYSVFDEKRVFKSGPLPGPINFRGVRLGVLICEDFWTPDCAVCLLESGAEILISPNGSPYEHDKTSTRMTHAVARVTETGLPFVMINQVGGQDELVFDGASFVLNADRSVATYLPSFRSHIGMTHWQRHSNGWLCDVTERCAPPNGAAAIYQALVLGLRDYVIKNEFPGVILGLSGGIDSALCAAISVDALGSDRVWAIMMPSPYTSKDSLEDAEKVAQRLNIRLDRISIEPAMQAFDEMLKQSFKGRPMDITEENLQSRARGVTLMALSNKFGHMLLSTGNKSEMSVGYATLYGDMCGGFAVLKDVYKMDVYACSEWRNGNMPEGGLGPSGWVIPPRVISKAPTAELRPNQKDEDNLPPYPILDSILHSFIEEDSGIVSVVEKGFDEAIVQRVKHMLNRAEYKRRQAPPGVKITLRAFGRDRRYPITNGFREEGP
ncbi:MAG: NAD+ synthase [Alphaproteobacteria bacterium]